VTLCGATIGHSSMAPYTNLFRSPALVFAKCGTGLCIWSAMKPKNDHRWLLVALLGLLVMIVRSF